MATLNLNENNNKTNFKVELIFEKTVYSAYVARPNCTCLLNKHVLCVNLYPTPSFHIALTPILLLD